MGPQSLEEYLSENFAKQVIDHSIRSHVNPDGTVTIYIHPSNVDGTTLDFKVEGNSLIPLNQ